MKSYCNACAFSFLIMINLSLQYQAYLYCELGNVFLISSKVHDFFKNFIIHFSIYSKIIIYMCLIHIDNSTVLLRPESGAIRVHTVYLPCNPGNHSIIQLCQLVPTCQSRPTDLLQVSSKILVTHFSLTL
jgi:hypothetical protein